VVLVGSYGHELRLGKGETPPILNVLLFEPNMVGMSDYVQSWEISMHRVDDDLNNQQQ
jgi:hypothetical protein